MKYRLLTKIMKYFHIDLKNCHVFKSYEKHGYNRAYR